MPQITALRVGRPRKQTIVIELDGAPWKEVDAEVVLRLALKSGAGLDGREMAAIEEEQAYVLARRRAVNYSLTAPRTRREVERHLAGARVPGPIGERVMTELDARGALDERAAVRRGVRRAERLGLGPRRLKADLAARGADAADIEAEIAPLEDANRQAERAEELARKRLARLAALAPEERRRKTADFLLRRGFDPEIVYGVLERLL